MHQEKAFVAGGEGWHESAYACAGLDTAGRCQVTTQRRENVGPVVVAVEPALNLVVDHTVARQRADNSACRDTLICTRNIYI